jgi:chromate transporter
VHLLNFANVLPGPEALELSIHLGYLRRGLWGGVASGLLFIWPGFVSLTALAWLYVEYGHLEAVSGFLNGVRPVAMALVAAAALRISRKVVKGWLSYLLMTAAFLASYLLDVPFLAILASCGLLGLWLGSRQKVAAQAHSPLLGWMFVVIVALLVGFHYWVAPGRLAQVAWVNTKAALVTFGGAYTVLPYLREQTVVRHGWLSDRHVIDALALGETTPGPLICFGIFLSYLAAGFPGAVVGTIFLFLPSFVLVLGLGRYIERVENFPRARDLLWGFSTGTLGLIIALAADLVPASIPNISSAGLAVTAFLAVWRLDVNLILLVLAGGAMGVVLGF